MIVTAMRFSVVIPCHNAEPWVGEALASVAEQAYQPHEVLVVLDACSDDSSRSVRESCVNCRVLEVNCGNGAGARNAGIEAASGDWVAFLDADDRWLPHHLAQAVDLLRGTDCVGYMSPFLYRGRQDVPRQGPAPYGISEPTAGLDHYELGSQRCRGLACCSPRATGVHQAKENEAVFALRAGVKLA